MQKITLNNLKAYLIHKLGGYTKTEFEKRYSFGYYMAIYNVRSVIKKIYGVDKQTWIDTVCNYIKKEYESR